MARRVVDRVDQRRAGSAGVLDGRERGRWLLCGRVRTDLVDSRSAQIKAVTVPDLDVLLSFERQSRLVISLSCTARLGTGDHDLPHMPVD